MKNSYIKTHLIQYSHMMVSDLYKLIYQMTFGINHLINDNARNYLYNEILNSNRNDLPIIEEIGNGMCRIYLNNLNINEVDFIYNEMLESSTHVGSKDVFLEYCEEALNVLKEINHQIKDYQFEEFVGKMLQLNLPQVHHSEKYKEMYDPHYRVVCLNNKIKEYFMKPIVYFTKELNAEAVVKLYKTLGKELKGNVAVKLHSGEPGNQNFIQADFWKPLINMVDGTVVECNTAYSGERNTSEKHLKTLEKHGWSTNFKVDLLDEVGPDLKLDIPNGRIIKENYVGKNIVNYDSLLVLSHFKGHPMGGFGGALKQLSIGVASSYGKAVIHGAGDAKMIWKAKQDDFIEAMADAALSVYEMFKDNAVYINVMKNLSVDCDCCSVAEDPCMKDIGMLISLDPVALDQACVDLIYASNDRGRDHFIERIESRHGTKILDATAQLGFGSREYKLINIDDDHE